VAQAGGGVVYHLTHQIPLGLVVSKSIDGGLTYPISTVGATPVDQTGCVCPPGSLIAEGGGGMLGLNDKVGFVHATSTGGVKIAISLYHTSTSGISDNVPESAQWFESYLESTDGGSTFSALETVDPTVVKTGPICTQGTGCSGDRELLDFQSDTIDNAGKANL